MEIVHPEEVGRYLPCSLFHNVLPSQNANELLHFLLNDAKQWKPHSWYLYERRVESKHTSTLFFDSNEDTNDPIEFWYNGSQVNQGRPFPALLQQAKEIIDNMVNDAMKKRKKYVFIF